MQADNDAIKYSCPSDDDYKDLDNVDQRKYSNMTDKDGPNAQYTLAGCLNMAIELNIFEIPKINGPPLYITILFSVWLQLLCKLFISPRLRWIMPCGLR
jgi:hypothetical protein